MVACVADSGCEGFTYHSPAKQPDGVLPVYFKSSPEANTDVAWSHYNLGEVYGMQIRVGDGLCIAARSSEPLLKDGSRAAVILESR